MNEYITDPGEVERLGKERQEENLRFRVFLKHDLDWSESRLRKVVLRVVDEVWAQIDCKECARCCEALEIPVEPKDARRLARRLGLAEEEFSTRHLKTRVANPETAELDDEAACFLSPPCPFLDGKICTVYEDRPKDCREFPYLHRSLRPRTLQAVANASLCPIVYNVLERLKELIPWDKRTP